MAGRPNFADLRSNSRDTLRSGLPSPRIEHFDGEVPPALSPLDAFAAQGRLLAKQLDESRRRDRRMSRLPPASVARSLSQPRPGYFRAPSSGDSQGLTRRPTQKVNPEVEQPKFRPQSEHPRLSGISTVSTDSYEDEDEPSALRSESEEMEMPRAESPEEDLSIRVDESEESRPLDPPVGFAFTGPSRHSSTDSVSRLNVPRNLAPPASPLSRPSSSARVNHPESSDDDYSSTTAGSTFSHPRKLSSSSAMSVPHSPMSPFARSHPRSPSLSSETSNYGANLPRPSFNFSRPLSRSSTSLSAPSPIAPSEQANSSQTSLINRGNKPNPIIVPSASDMCLRLGEAEPSSAVSSYIYAKYSLPRGRMVSRDSLIFSGLQTPHFEWKEPLFESSPPPSASRVERKMRTPSPPPTRHQPENPQTPAVLQESRGTNRQTLNAELATPSPQPPEVDVPSQPSPEPCRPGPTVVKCDDQDETVSSADSASTIRPRSGQAAMPPSTAVLSADQHVTLGIECHEKGSLKESTYHLRIAAKQNHPTAMLLYALACRHGWGMRPNQREGVQWLRKAVDCVGLELKEEPDTPGKARAQELMAQKAYRAQFALSIYELGVSHLNGWGIEQDKSLALRCFEIAGQWGDVDALAEAGFCYAEGIGCRKDMKKAARFYRQAENKGMNIVGNSWIYKDKYMSDDENSRSRSRNAGTPEKKNRARSKSRTRSIFHRKKSVVSEH